jgi:hypothetical protein
MLEAMILFRAELKTVVMPNCVHGIIFEKIKNYFLIVISCIGSYSSDDDDYNSDD